MSELRAAKAGDQAAFPGSTFVVDDTPPIAQCQETQITIVGGTITQGLNTVTEMAAFKGIDLAGKNIDVTDPVPERGNYTVLSNTDDVLTTDYTFLTTGDILVATIQDLGEGHLTRNESSFQRFTENAAKAHTTKGGQLFVDVASGPMAGACSDTFNPR